MPIFAHPTNSKYSVSIHDSTQEVVISTYTYRREEVTNWGDFNQMSSSWHIVA
jgi:hypothetical protein